MIRFTAISRTAVLLTVASGVLTAAQPAFATDDDTVPQAARTSPEPISPLPRRLPTSRASCAAPPSKSAPGIGTGTA